jgi:serine/threonine-protein kinase
LEIVSLCRKAREQVVGRSYNEDVVGYLNEASRETPRTLGRYVLYQELASGGVGSVCLARMRAEAGFSRMMAVKRLHPHHARDAQFVAMFLDEARTAARIRHPNVVSVLDVVAAEREHFLVMEYVPGEALSKLLAAARERQAPVEPATAVSIMSGVLEGLHAAHMATNERGVPLRIVHRDVSPQNVMVGVDGVARVLDFGVAKAVGRLQESTQAGQMKGKLMYMPPEQFAEGADVDRRSDVWAASLVLWEMLVGAPMFADVNAALRFQAGAEAFVAPSARGGPSVLDAVVMKGLARNPDERFQSARELLVAMERLVPPAPARRVAQWVNKFAKEALARRAAYVEEIEAEAARQSAAFAVAGTADARPTVNPRTEPDTLSAADVSARPANGGKRALGAWFALAVTVTGLGLAAFHPSVRARFVAKRAPAPRVSDVVPAPLPLAPLDLVAPSSADPALPELDASAPPVSSASPPSLRSEKRVHIPTNAGPKAGGFRGRPTFSETVPSTKVLAPSTKVDPLDLDSRQ